MAMETTTLLQAHEELLHRNAWRFCLTNKSSGLGIARRKLKRRNCRLRGIRNKFKNLPATKVSCCNCEPATGIAHHSTSAAHVTGRTKKSPKHLWSREGSNPFRVREKTKSKHIVCTIIALSLLTRTCEPRTRVSRHDALCVPRKRPFRREATCREGGNAYRRFSVLAGEAR